MFTQNRIVFSALHHKDSRPVNSSRRIAYKRTI